MDNTHLLISAMAEQCRRLIQEWDKPAPDLPKALQPKHLLWMARLPAEVNWKVMLGAACLAGIGFTMSIFIAGLALQGNLLDDGKIGTLVGSTISAILGCVLLLMFMPKRPEAPVGAHEQKADNNDIPGAQVPEDAPFWPSSSESV